MISTCQSHPTHSRACNDATIAELPILLQLNSCQLKMIKSAQGMLKVRRPIFVSNFVPQGSSGQTACGVRLLFTQPIFATHTAYHVKDHMTLKFVRRRSRPGRLIGVAPLWIFGRLVVHAFFLRPFKYHYENYKKPHMMKAHKLKKI